MQKILISTLISFFLYSFSFGVKAKSHREIVLLKYKKASKAYSRENFRDAVFLLKSNLKSKVFHYKSFELLAKIYDKKGRKNNSKKILMYAFRKLFIQVYSKQKYMRFKKLNQKNKIDEFLSQVDKRPVSLLLKASFKTAVFLKENFSNDEKILGFAIKLFYLCQKFDYQKSYSNYHLGIISSKKKMHKNAVKELLLSEEDSTYNNSLSLNSKEDLKRLTTLGESLIEEGHIDMGTVYLRLVLFDERGRDSEKEIASLYLNTLSGKTFSSFVKIGVNYSSNLNELNDIDRKDQEILDFLKTIDAVSTIKNAGIYYSSDDYRSYSYLLSLSLKEELMQKKEIDNNDSRKVNSNFSLKYNNFYKSILKLDYSLTNSFGREDQGNDFSLKYHSHSFSPGITYITSMGHLSYGLNIFYTDNKWSEDLMEKGLVFSVTPFATNKYLHPTFTLNLSLADENNAPDSKNVALSITNFFSFTKKISSFSTLNYSFKKSSTDSDSYQEIFFLMNFSYKISKSLIADFSYLPKYNQSFDDKKTTSYEVNTNLKYYF